MAEIFLSYARADQARIEQLAVALEGAGYTLWWDRHIKGGKRFAKDIEAAITQSKAVLVAWSETSVESEWVLDEASYGRDANKLVPVQLDDTLPPFGYRQRQAINLNAPDGHEQLRAALDELIDGDHEDIAPAKAAGRGPKLALLAIPLLLLLAAVAWFVMQQMSGDDSAVTADARDSIAILPFVAQSSDEDDQFFADGVTEEILNRLDAVEELRVLPRTTVFSLRDNEDALNVLADKLKVDYIVEGSLRRGGDNVRVTARLIRASDDETLWSNSYDGTRDDVLNFQSDIAEKVASSLNVLLDESTLARMRDAGIDDPEAFAIFAEAAEGDIEAHLNLGGMRPLYEVSQLYDRAFEAAPKLWESAVAASDYYSHVILNAAAGIDAPAEMIQEAPAQMQRRLAMARDAAPQRQDQIGIELYAKAFTDDWSDIQRLSAQYYANHDSCELPNWAGFLIDSTGPHDKLASAYLGMEDCRAGDRLHTYFLVDAMARARKFDEGRAYLDRERQRGMLDSSFLDLMQGRLEHAYGNRAGAIALMERGVLAENEGAQLSLKLLRSDDAAVTDTNDFLERNPSLSGWQKMTYLAASGQRDRANSYAADIDARPGGVTLLQQSVDYCGCGAPFDIARTPNYGAALQRAGIEWPFRVTYDWPLKDW